MLKKFAMITVAAASLGAASFGMSASAEARPRWHLGHPNWHHPHRPCVTKKVWRHNHWVVKKICWIN